MSTLLISRRRGRTGRPGARSQASGAAAAVRIVAAVLFPVAAVAGLGALGLGRTMNQLQEHPRPTGAQPAPAPYGSGPVKVAVVLGSTGTVATDALGPFEVFAASPVFTVYTVAARGGVAPADGAPGVVPVYTFDQVDRGQAPAPDIVVVPALGHPEGPEEEPVRRFVAERANHGAHILSVCNGAAVVAATGLLDGHRATAHWSRLRAYRRERPLVDWVAGERYVDTTVVAAGGGGTTTVTSTAGITSGIPGALHVLAGIAGREEARRVGRLVGYPGWTPQGSTEIPVQSWALRDVPTLLNNAAPWGRPTIGVDLRDGVDELDVTAAFEVHTVSQAARAIALSQTGWVTTRHGMVLAATPTAAAPRLDDRLTLPSGDSGPGRGFDGALQDLADSAGTNAAASAAKMIDYPAVVAGSSVRWQGVRAGVVLLVTTCAASVLSVVIYRRRRRH